MSSLARFYTSLYVTTIQVILCAQYSSVQGIPLDEFFEFNFTSTVESGETQFPPVDDMDHVFDLNVPFLFYNSSYTRIDVNTNGILAFGEDVDVDYTPMQFPRTSNVPVIAPFWADVDTSGGIGNIWARDTTTDTAAIGKVSNLVVAYFDDSSDFVAAEVVIVTWYKVGYYHDSSTGTKVNTFQCVLASDGTKTFAIFLYLDDGINWTTGDNNDGTEGLGGTRAQAGFDAGNENNFTVIEGSFTDDIINIEEKSNVGVPGLFIFQINGVIRTAEKGIYNPSKHQIYIVTLPESKTTLNHCVTKLTTANQPCPVVGSSACKERLIQSACSYIRKVRDDEQIPKPCKN